MRISSQILQQHRPNLLRVSPFTASKLKSKEFVQDKARPLGDTLPVMPATNVNALQKNSNDCPCYEVTSRKQLYLRPTPATQNDVSIDIPYTRKVCTATTGKKRVQIDCEHEVGEILKKVGKLK